MITKARVNEAAGLTVKDCLLSYYKMLIPILKWVILTVCDREVD